MRAAIVIIVGLWAAWLIGAWSLMLMVGILHDSWWHFIPLMGHTTAFSISLVALVTGIVSIVVAALMKELV